MQLPDLTTLTLCPHASIARGFWLSSYGAIPPVVVDDTKRRVREYISSSCCPRPPGSPLLTVLIGDDEVEVRTPRMVESVSRDAFESSFRIVGILDDLEGSGLGLGIADYAMLDTTKVWQESGPSSNT